MYQFNWGNTEGSVVFETYSGSQCTESEFVEAGGYVLGVCIPYSSASSSMYYDCLDSGDTVSVTYKTWTTGDCSGESYDFKNVYSTACTSTVFKQARCSESVNGWLDYSTSVYKE